jgi:hypothetical protein
MALQNRKRVQFTAYRRFAVVKFLTRQAASLMIILRINGKVSRMDGRRITSPNSAVTIAADERTPKEFTGRKGDSRSMINPKKSTVEVDTIALAVI